MSSVLVYDTTASDELSRVRGVGRYLQILRENFEDWSFGNLLEIRNSKLDIFVNPFFNLLQPPLLTKRIAQKQIAVIHDLIPLKYPDHFPAGIRGRLNIFRNKLALRNYDLIVTDSQTSKVDIIKILGVKEDKIKIIYPCLPKAFQSSNVKVQMSNQIQNLKEFCLYVGDVTWNKNLVNLAKAIKLADVKCVFVGKNFGPGKNSVLGDPWKREFNKFLNFTKNDKHFIFAGYVHDRELINLYQQVVVNVLVSHDEGFGFSYLEAASQSCPSVLSDIPTLKEITGDTASFANPNDPADIASKIKEIFKNKDLRKDLAEKSKKRAADFSPKNFVNQWQKAVENKF